MENLPEQNLTSDTANSFFSFKKFLFIWAVLLVLLDLGFLNWKVLKGASVSNLEQFALEEKESRGLIKNDLSGVAENADCPTTCKTMINQATSSIKPGETKTVVEKETVTNTQTVTQKTSVAQEFYVPLGSGATVNREWTEIKSAEGYIDMSKYSGKVSAYFEAFLYNYTGNGATFARLYNVTDKSNVWFSELTINGVNSPTRVTSGKINLSSGNKLYRVQLYTNTGYEARIENARVRIVSE